jgi:hypothetical protein
MYYDYFYGKIETAALRNERKIYKGKNHAQCFLAEPYGVLRCAEQGFVTEKGVFVGRRKAYRIAKHYNQIKHKHPPLNKLLSEDLI